MRRVSKIRLVFIGISGFDYPHTRVRCFNFARQLARYGDMETSVLSFRDHLGNRFAEVEMWGLRERYRLIMTAKAFLRLAPHPGTVFFVQKLHFHSAVPYLLSRLGLNRMIFDYDDYDVDLTVSFKSPGLNRFFFKSADHGQMTANIAREALGCTASSRYLVDFLKQYNDRVAYISTGVDIDQFPLTDRSDRAGPVTFLWTGIVWGDEILDGILMALRCFRRVLRELPDARFQIIGAGQLMSRVDHALAGDFADLSANVERISWVAPADMPRYLADADIGILPLTGDSRWLKSKSPTKMFEYMATGLPVVASDMGEVRNVIRNGESGILASGEDAFSAAMIRLATDRNARVEMGRSARMRIERHYSLPVLCERLYWYIKDLLR